MSKLITILLLITPNLVFAGDYACFNAGHTIANKVVSKRMSAGRAYSIRDDCIRIPRDSYLTMNNLHKVSGGTSVIPLTQEEKDLLSSISAANSASNETNRILLFDNSISSAKIADATLAKVDAKIDAIASLDDAKTFLKRLARYLLND